MQVSGILISLSLSLLCSLSDQDGDDDTRRNNKCWLIWEVSVASFDQRLLSFRFIFWAGYLILIIVLGSSGHSKRSEFW